MMDKTLLVWAYYFTISCTKQNIGTAEVRPYFEYHIVNCCGF
jgi:hypothetical protein